MGSLRGFGVLVGIAATFMVGQPAAADEMTVTARPAFELPFPCGEQWQGATYSGHGSNNYALDLNKGSGSDDYGEEVVASAAGEVSVRTEGDGDHVVVVNHGAGWTSEYRHMATRTRTSGHVNAGDRVGTVGRESHGDSISPHLHYEQKLNGTAQHIYFHGQPITYSYVYNGPTFTSFNCGGGAPTMPGELPGVTTISRTDGNLDVFAKDANGSFKHKHWNGSTWSAWINLGGEFLSNPSAVNWGSSRLDVFGIGMNGTLWQRTWTATNGWYPWVDTGGGRVQWTPAVTSRGFGSIDAFAVNDDEQVMHRNFNTTTGWSQWVNLGGTASAPPAATALGADRLNVLVRDASGTLATKMWTASSGWYNWVDRQIAIFGGPSVSHRTDAAMDVFVRHPQERTLMHVFSGDGGATYRAPVNLDGTLRAAPASVSWAANRIDVFVRGANGHLYQRIWTATNGWYGYVDIGTV
jgi:hypothetical protein